MKKTRLWKVTLYNRYATSEKRVETVNAKTAEDAEQMMHDEYFGDGWGILDSRPVFENGDLVKWNDPAIADYDPAEREMAKNCVYKITDIDPDYEDDDQTVIITDPRDELHEIEVLEGELELCTEKPLRVKADIYKCDILAAEKCLADNGIDPEETSAVLQAIGYILLDAELYGNEVAIKLQNELASAK